MNRLAHKYSTANRRQARVKARLHGNKNQPRLRVRVSNMHISAQLIDDELGHTMVSVSTVGSKQAAGTKTEKAIWVGSEIAKKAKTAKIKRVVFDRGSKLYHGRIKALAEAARKEGLDF